MPSARLDPVIGAPGRRLLTPEQWARWRPGGRSGGAIRHQQAQQVAGAAGAAPREESEAEHSEHHHTGGAGQSAVVERTVGEVEELQHQRKHNPYR